MGLFDKIKDLFMDEVTDEEDFELEEDNKNIYEEPKDILPKVMRDTIKKEEENIKFEELKPSREETKKFEEPQHSKEEKKFSFPIDFEEEVMPSRVANRNVLVEKEREREIPKKEVQKKVTELYPKKEVVVEKPKFKPTPVISPVYGILDKNYRKDEVIEKSEENSTMKRPSKKVDFETVRKKAFGNLVDEIKENLMCENCELYKEVKRISSIPSDDLLYDMMVDEEVKKDEPVTIEKAYDNYEDFGVAYEPKRETPKVENNTTIINNNTEVTIAEKIEIEEKVIDKEEVSHKEVPEVESIPSRQEKKKEFIPLSALNYLDD
jgi:hypothetical protein